MAGEVVETGVHGIAQATRTKVSRSRVGTNVAAASILGGTFVHICNKHVKLVPSTSRTDTVLCFLFSSILFDMIQHLYSPQIDSPWQVKVSAVSSEKRSHSQWKSPNVLTQVCSHPPLFVAHSSTSEFL